MNQLADILRLFLLGGMFGMTLLAWFYLRWRKLSWGAYLAWGLLALLLPVVGPFVVISARPKSNCSASPV